MWLPFTGLLCSCQGGFASAVPPPGCPSCTWSGGTLWGQSLPPGQVHRAARQGPTLRVTSRAPPSAVSHASCALTAEDGRSRMSPFGMNVQGPGQALHPSAPAQPVHPLPTGDASTPLCSHRQPCRHTPRKAVLHQCPGPPHRPSPQAQFPGTFPVCDTNQAPTPEGEGGDATVSWTRWEPTSAQTPTAPQPHFLTGN